MKNIEYYNRKQDDGKRKSLLHERMLRAVVFAMQNNTPYGCVINEILGYMGVNKHERIATVFASISEILDHGAIKYKPDSWQTLPDAIERYKDALKRHWVDKNNEIILDSFDGDSGIMHFKHALCNCMFLTYLTEVKK